MEYKFNTQFQQPRVGNEILHNAKTVLVLGILSILGAFIYIVPGLIFGIISISLYKKELQIYNENPQSSNQSSYNTLKTGRNCAINGLLLSSLFILIMVLAFFSYISI